MASKPMNIRWIRTGSQVYSNILQTILHEYLNKNHKLNTSFVSVGFQPLWFNKTGFNLIIFILICDNSLGAPILAGSIPNALF